MKRYLVFICLLGVILVALFIISVSLYRSIELIDNYFPGFFIYPTKSISIYDTPEWWESRKQGIPPKTILIKLNDIEIKTSKDYWDIVYQNLKNPVTYKVEYKYNGESFVKFLNSQKFTLKDYVFFALFWQLAGVLIVITGIIIFLGNSNKKGIYWLVAFVLTGLNFIATPATSLISEYPIIYFFERFTFSLFPASLFLLFLNFPLIKFRKVTRLVLVSIISGIGISVFFISVLGYFYSEELLQIQEMYYWYPGLAGILVVFSPIYDYIKLYRAKFYQFSRAVLPIALGGVIFILIPSIVALVTSFSLISPYYIPALVLFYPVIPIASLMINAARYFRTFSIGLSLILIISLIFSSVSFLLYFVIPSVPFQLKLIVIVIISVFLSNFAFRLFFNKFVANNKIYDVDKNTLIQLLSEIKRFNTIESFVKFLDMDFGKKIGFSFSKFVSHKFLTYDLKKLLVFMSSNFLTKDNLERCCKEIENTQSNFLPSAFSYVMVLKYRKKFFGIVFLGKKLGGNKLLRKEILTMEVISVILSEYFGFLVTYMGIKDIGEQKFLGVNKFLTQFISSDTKIDYERFSVKVYLGKDTLKPVIYKVKDLEEKVYFCIVWLPVEAIHPFLVNLGIKGIIEEYFYEGSINFNRMAREIRNFVSRLTSVELDVNILIGSIDKKTNIMKVLNDGKTSIFLVTKRYFFVSMPLYKREFEFTKIKEGDTFFFVTAEEVSSQIKEIEEMKVERFRIKKFLREINSELVMEINFYSRTN
ncbi:MAG: hypothetical protein ACP5QP_03870 [Brevinematia bacterium]